jgi:5-methylthioadenosine/S-adenosylhomocysteine deaminase
VTGNHGDDSTLLLEHAYVLTLDRARTRGMLSVAVTQGRIAAVDSRSALRTRFPRARRISCRHRVLIPGLVNAHLHPELHVLKGELEELNLHDWKDAERFNAAVDFLGTAAGAAAQVAAIRAALAEAVLGGTTCVGTYGVSNGSEVTCEAGLREIGLRGTVTLRDETFAPLDGTATAWQRPTPAMYRLHAEERLDIAELEAARRAHDRGERIVMHAAETRHRLDLVRHRFGTTTIRLLHSYGLLSPRTLLSHAVFVDDEEIAMIARAGACVVVSPAAEMKLADGIPPVQDMQRHGIPVAIGTDAAVCNNGTDMFLEMRLLGLSQKLRYGAGAAPAEQILLMATRAGAAVLGAAGSVGALEPGMEADIIAVDTRNPRMQPLVFDDERSNVAANLVYAATAADVTDVMIGGRWIVRQRRLLTAHAGSLWSGIAHAAHSLHSRLQPSR